MGTHAEQELGEHEGHIESHANRERTVEAGRRVVMAVAMRMIVVIVVIVVIVRVRHLVARLVSGAAAHW